MYFSLKKYILLFFFLFSFLSIEATSPKYEIRGVWLTTNWGLDWPKKIIKTEKDIKRQQEELCYLLEQVQKMNMNVVFFQTRLRGDVLYSSRYEPWSSVLTGISGKNPGYDPLRFVVEECHRRGLQCHAWLVCMPLGTSRQIKNQGKSSVVSKYPDMCKYWDREWYLDPGNPKTALYLASIAGEIVSNYGVDGIHLDYIRYPDKAGFPDRKTYLKYGSSDKTLNQWRRENINKIVYTVYDSIKKIDPAVKLSSAVIGKYNTLPVFSSLGWSGIESVHQDPVEWLKQNKHDFIVPMMYFSERSFYPFLIDWVKHCAGHPIVSGLGAYRLCVNDGDWRLQDFMRQVYDGRRYGAGGQTYYRLENLINNEKFVYTAILQAYRYPALYPPMNYMGKTLPCAPDSLCVEYKTLSTFLYWDSVTNVREYVLYGSDRYPVNTNDPANIIASGIRGCSFETSLKKRFYAVTAVDMYHQESIPVQMSFPEIYYKGADNEVVLSNTLKNFDRIAIFNIFGKKIYEGKFKISIKTDGLFSGVYRVELYNNRGKEEKILIVN